MILAEVRPGLSGEREVIVTDAMVTTHAGGGRGGVLTTPAVIGLMEGVAQEVTRPYLPRDCTTVGFEISVRHLRPTPLGMAVRVSAELLEVDGRKLLFKVEAHNEKGLVATGTLRRTIVRLGQLDERSG
jgi:predicted thioesterase